jgi:zinc protease
MRKNMNRFLLICLLNCLTLSLLSCATTQTKNESNGSNSSQAPGKEVVPLSGKFKVHRFIFENGLRLLVVEDHSSPTFAYQTWFRVGSRDEVPGKTGLAHLFEHMMFKETKNMKEGEFDRLLESAGAEGENAFTSRDYTAYVQELPKDKLELIAKAEADRMVNLIINEKAFKTETEVVQNERRFRNENSPDGLMDQELFHLAFTEHPYHWPVIGYQKDLSQMSAQDALKFYRSYYSPNHATVIVVGDVDPEQVRSTIEKYYGNLPRQDSPPHVIAKEPPQTAPRKKQLPLNIQVEKLVLGYRIPPVTHADMPTLNVIQDVLTGGKSSRLYQALVETGIASSVGAYDFEDKDPSLFVIMVNLQKGRKASEAESVILKQMDRLGKEPILSQELERAKNKLVFSFYQNLDSNFEKAYFLGHYESTAGGFEEGIKQLKKIQEVAPAQIQAAARRYLSPKDRTVIIGVPK